MKRWNGEDLNFLKKHYSDLPLSELAEILGRSEASVRQKMKKMGWLRGHWEYHEICFLKENYGRIPAQEIAKQLNRSVRSVDGKLQTLAIRNLREYHFWTTGEEAQLIDLYSNTLLSPSQMAKRISNGKFSPHAIQGKIQKLVAQNRIKRNRQNGNKYSRFNQS